MPAYSGNKRSYDGSMKKWGNNNNRGNNNKKSRGARGRLGGKPGPLLNNPMMNPWENGMSPSMNNYMNPNFMGNMNPSSFSNRDGFSDRNFSSRDFFSRDAPFQPPPQFDNYGNFSKMGRFDRMGGYDDNRGRGLLPAPPNSLLGPAPSGFSGPSPRGSDLLQNRLGPWNPPFESGNFRGMGSSYYPSNRGSRKFAKARRPLSTRPVQSRVGKFDKKDNNKTKGKDSSTQSKDSKKKSGETSANQSKPERKNDDPDNEKEEDEEVEEEEAKMDDSTKEESSETEKKDDKDGSQAQEYPPEALYCHICDLANFATKKGYIRHLQAITHAKMAELYHAKNAASLELLNISAKLSEMRQRDKTLRRTGKKSQPTMKTAEQILVKRMLKAHSCCGIKFSSPFEMEEHKLTPHHLKKRFLARQKPFEEDGEGEEFEEEEKTSNNLPLNILEWTDENNEEFKALIDEAKKVEQEKPLTQENIPMFDGNDAFGLQFVEPEQVFRCTSCKSPKIKGSSMKIHCQSQLHYDTIVTHLNKQEDAKREEERLKKEEEIKEKKKREGKKSESEKSATEDVVEVMDEEGADEREDHEDDVILMGEDEERIINEGVSFVQGDDDDDEEAQPEPEEPEGQDIFAEVGEDA